MVVGIGVLELHLPQSRSLKDKRRVIKSLIERLHGRYRVSVAETDHQELHQRAEVAVAVVARSEPEVRAILESVRATADDESEAVLLDWQLQIVEEAE